MSYPYAPYDGRPHFGLTTREREIISLVSAGYTNKDLAEEFGISENAAHDYLTHVFEKLGVSNPVELVLFVAHHGLIDSD
jgi:DNA-binding NarL/FixJ family response regulator